MNKRKLLVSLLIPVLLFTGCSVTSSPTDNTQIGLDFPDSTWQKITQFDGYQTKADPSKVSDGANPQGQNTVINDGDRISIRNKGYELFGAASTTPNPITSLHTFRRRSGENILMRSSSTTLEYYEEGNDTWESIGNSYTAGAPFSFAEYNINTDQSSFVYFGNGQDPLARWNGAHTLTSAIVNAGDTSVPVVDTSGFTTTGTIHYCNTDVVYTSKTATAFAVASAAACGGNYGVTQAPVTYPTAPRGNIMINASNRIFIAGITTTPQAVYFSAYGDATNYVGASLVTDGTNASPGIFNLAEGGGAVTAMVLDEGSIYIFKKSIIYKATLDDAIYTLTPLKPFDGKSQSTGALTQDSTFSSGNNVYFITPDKQMMDLSRVTNINYPQITPISDPVKPTFESAIFSSSTGIFWKDTAYQAVRSQDGVVSNDSVFVYNARRQAWESPIIGWPVSSWAIYDDGTGEALYFGDSTQTQVFKVTDTALDNELGVTANWRSKQFDFGLPYAQKEMDNFFIEGYISDNTSLTISLLLDEDGATQIYSTTFTGTETAYSFDSAEFNLFGFHPFGYERFGSGDSSGRHKFRIYLNKDFRITPFYRAQVEFASDGENQDWEINSFAFKTRESTQPYKRSIFRAFN